MLCRINDLNAALGFLDRDHNLIRFKPVIHFGFR